MFGLIKKWCKWVNETPTDNDPFFDAVEKEAEVVEPEHCGIPQMIGMVIISLLIAYPVYMAFMSGGFS